VKNPIIHAILAGRCGLLCGVVRSGAPLTRCDAIQRAASFPLLARAEGTHPPPIDGCATMAAPHCRHDKDFDAGSL
jgi:hypothetical protein